MKITEEAERLKKYKKSRLLKNKERKLISKTRNVHHTSHLFNTNFLANLKSQSKVGTNQHPESELQLVMHWIGVRLGCDGFCFIRLH